MEQPKGDNEHPSQMSPLPPIDFSSLDDYSIPEWFWAEVQIVPQLSFSLQHRDRPTYSKNPVVSKIEKGLSEIKVEINKDT